MTRMLGAVLGACLLALGGCVHSTKARFVEHYDLGGPDRPGTSTPQTPASGGRILQVARLSVPSWLAGNGMYYRLDYRDDHRLAAYGESDWIAPPATLLEPIIENALAAGGGWRAVLGPRNPASADVGLHLQINDFLQVFQNPDDSSGVIDVVATLVDNHDSSVIAQRRFHVAVAAPTPDAGGGAKALAQAGNEFASRLQQWLQDVGQANGASTPAAKPPR